MSNEDTLFIPPSLFERVERLAAAEGISADAFMLRCIEDIIGWMERDPDDEPEAQPSSVEITAEESRRRARQDMLEWLKKPRPTPEREPRMRDVHQDYAKNAADFLRPSGVVLPDK